jgi:hypothetical protein
MMMIFPAGTSIFSSYPFLSHFFSFSVYLFALYFFMSLYVTKYLCYITLSFSFIPCYLCMFYHNMALRVGLSSQTFKNLLYYFLKLLRLYLLALLLPCCCLLYKVHASMHMSM